MSLHSLDDSKFINVHALTSTINQCLSQELNQFRGNSNLAEVDALLKDIFGTYKLLPEYASDSESLRKIDVVLTKIYARSNHGNGNYLDPDLGNINIFFLLKNVWDSVKKSESYAEFYETLLEMGTLCTQGDSHRLLALSQALNN